MAKHAYTLKVWEVLDQPSVCGRGDPFFALHSILRGKLDICGLDDLQRTCPPFAQRKYGNPTFSGVFRIYKGGGQFLTS